MFQNVLAITFVVNNYSYSHTVNVPVQKTKTLKTKILTLPRIYLYFALTS